MLQMVFAGSMERGYWIADFCKIEKINLNTVEPGLKIRRADKCNPEAWKTGLYDI